MSKKQVPSIPGEAYLIIESQVFSLSTAVTKIGRKMDNDIVIHKDNISREHAQIKYTAGQFVISDTNSTGGTFVNNKKIDQCVLNSGDVIRLSDVKIMFVGSSGKIRANEQFPTRSLID